MISAKEYFEQYLAYQRKESSLRSASFTYEPYAGMDLAALEAESDAGNPAAQEELGERYLFGLDDLHADVFKARELFTAAKGNPDAMHMLAETYRVADYGDQDYDKYFELLEQAAELGAWKSMFNLACAYYKGKDAYDGHGPETDRLKALVWSTHCAVMTMQLLEIFFTQPCSSGFTDYLDSLYALFVQSVSVSARQLIRGDGVERDLKWAKTLLTEAQDFHRHYFQAACSDFTEFLKLCDEA